MIQVPITWVREPRRLAPVPLEAGDDSDAAFVEEVGRFAGLKIPAVRGFLRDIAPSEGIILLTSQGDPRMVIDECTSTARHDLAARLVPIDVSRHSIFEEILEPLSIPAAVDGLTLFEWRGSDRDTPGAWGPYGLRDIGKLVGASCALFESARYCYLHSPAHRGLPHLLADYLAAYVDNVLMKA